MTDRERKAYAWAGIALFSLWFCGGVHALAMQGGIWRAACPVWEGVR